MTQIDPGCAECGHRLSAHLPSCSYANGQPRDPGDTNVEPTPEEEAAMRERDDLVIRLKEEAHWVEIFTPNAARLLREAAAYIEKGNP